MPFKIVEPIDLYAAGSMHDAYQAGNEKAVWKSYNFPTPSELRKNRSYATQNLSMLKVMMAESDLISGRDYVFQGVTNGRDYMNSTSIGFRDDAEGLMMLLRWVSSNWYRKQNR